MKKVKMLLVLCLVLILNINSIHTYSYSVLGQELRTQVLYLANIIDDDSNMNEPVTRFQFAKMVVKASEYKDSVNDMLNTAVFSDVPVYFTNASYIKIATEKGYMTSFLGGLFKPNDFVSYKDLIRATLALLGYTNEDFTGNQINGRYQKFCSLDLDENIECNINDYITKLDAVNAIYNMLKANPKFSSNAYGVTVFKMTKGSDGELNASGLIKTKMEGPFLLKRGQSLSEKLPFEIEGSNIFINGTASTFEQVNRELGNTGFIIYYFNRATKTLYVYRDGTSIDQTVAVAKGYIVNIYYSASDNLTPTSVQIDQGRYYLGNTDVKFAFSYAGTLHIGDQVVFVFDRVSAGDLGSDTDDAGFTYLGTITQAYIYDLNY